MMYISHCQEISGYVTTIDVIRQKEKYEEAAALYQRALSIYESTLDSGHPYIAASLNNLAKTYHGQGRYEEAEAFYQRAYSNGKSEPQTTQ